MKIKNFVENVKKNQKVNLLIPFATVTFSLIALSLPGTYITYNLLSTIPDQNAKRIVSFLGVVAPLFIGIFGFIGWVIVSGIYYQLCNLFLKPNANVTFKKFLYVAGFIFPIKVVTSLVLMFLFFRMSGFDGFHANMSAEDVRLILEHWKISSNRIDISTSYLYLGFLSISLSYLFDETRKKIALVLGGSYTIWLVIIETIRRIVF